MAWAVVWMGRAARFTRRRLGAAMRRCPTYCTVTAAITADAMMRHLRQMEACSTRALSAMVWLVTKHCLVKGQD